MFHHRPGEEYFDNEGYERDERAIVKKLVKKDMICLDIGANIGYYTVLLAKLAKQVYAFEPEESNYQLLNKNILEKGNCNVAIFHTAVSDQDGVTQLYKADEKHNGHYGMARTYESKWHDRNNPPVTVPTMKIDSLDLKPNFIKMDVEGSEFYALKGMINTLERYQPIIMMEFNPPSIEESGAMPEKVWSLLKGLGYQITLIPNLEIKTYYDLDLLSRVEGGGKNILCIPSFLRRSEQ